MRTGFSPLQTIMSAKSAEVKLVSEVVVARNSLCLHPAPLHHPYSIAPLGTSCTQVLTTSNITGAIDLAFVDRADIKAFIGPPSIAARYEMLRGCVGELARVGIVAAPPLLPWRRLQVGGRLVATPA